MKQVLTLMSVLALSATAFGQTAVDPTTSATTTVTNMEVVTPAAKKWGLTLFQGVYSGIADANTGNFADSTGDSFVDLSYKLNDLQKVSIRQNFWANQSDATVKNEYELYDFMARFSQSKAFQIAGSDVALESRIYLPVSDWSQEIGKIEFRQSMAFDRNLAKDLTASFGAQGRLYGYTKDQDGQRGARSFVDAKLAYELNKTFVPYALIQHEGSWRHNGLALSPTGSRSEKPANYNGANLYIGSAVNVSDNFSLEVYVEQDRDLSKTDNYELFNQDESIYALEMAVSI